MTVREHFLELKRRLITCLIFLAAGWGISFALSGDIIEKMIGDAVSFGYTVMAAAPQESLMQRLSREDGRSIAKCLLM